MDQEEMSVSTDTCKNSCQLVEGIGGNSMSLVNGVVPETVTVKSSNKNVCFSRKNVDSRLQNNGLGSCQSQGVDYGVGNGQLVVNGVVSETIILKSSKENADLCKLHEVDRGRGIVQPVTNGIVSETVIVKICEENGYFSGENVDSRSRINGFESFKHQEVDHERGSSKPSVNGVVSETVIAKISEETIRFNGENVDLRLQNNGFVSRKHYEVDYGSGIGQPLIGGVVSHTIIVKDPEENVCFNGENAESRLQINGFGSCTHREVDHGRGADQPSVNGIVTKTVHVKRSEENVDSRLQNNDFGLCNHQKVDYGRGIGHPLVSEVASETLLVENSEVTADSKVQNNGFGLFKHQEVDYGRRIGQPFDQNELGSTGKSSSLVNVNVHENEGRDSGENKSLVVSGERLVEGNKQLINKDTNEKSRVHETLDQVDQQSSKSSCDTVDDFEGETAIVKKAPDAACVDGSNVVLKVKDDGFDSSKVLTELPKPTVVKAEDLCLIDIKGTSGVRSQFKEHYDGESLCRICHLNSEQLVQSSTTTATMDLIQIGCGCKDELGIAHNHCAEAWFKVKGNRLCEICGQTAENITGVRDNAFIENWYHQGSTAAGVSSSEQGRGRWHGQPYCNFLMAFLVIAFVLPWFFHVELF